jgi:glucose-6-phosphate-specific signal transduction histidine kinase
VALLLATPDTRRLHIRLIYEPDQLCLTLNGDGHNEPRRGHPTLLAMEERAALQGGTLTLEDGFKLCIPLGRPSTDRRPVPPHWE